MKIVNERNSSVCLADGGLGGAKQKMHFTGKHVYQQGGGKKNTESARPFIIIMINPEYTRHAAQIELLHFRVALDGRPPRRAHCVLLPIRRHSELKSQGTLIIN